jgi:hypothetical protein
MNGEEMASETIQNSVSTLHAQARSFEIFQPELK